MNLIFGALLPVFFVLALGYSAGKYHSFNPDQAAGFSKLALTFALPATLFTSMTEIARSLILQQGRLIVCLILVHVGLFLVAWRLLRLFKKVSSTASLLFALAVSTSATPVFGLAVLEPLLGATSAGTVGLVALAINLTVPLAVVLLEMDAASKSSESTVGHSMQSPMLTGIKAGLKSPLLWAPILGITLVIAGFHLPAVVASCFELIGSATSGVAVFTVGITLAAHAFRLSGPVLLGSLARVSIQTALLFTLLHLWHVTSPLAREALICCSFPLATTIVLFAARYKSAEAETASMLLLSTLALIVTVPAILWVSH